MQRRGKKVRCPLEAKWWIFAPECSGRTYVEGMVGSVSKDAFKGQGPKPVPTYIYEEIDVGAGVKDAGFFQVIDGPADCAKIDELKRQRWINQFTQFYRLDFVLYNPNVSWLSESCVSMAREGICLSTLSAMIESTQVGLFAVIHFKVVFDNTGLLIPGAFKISRHCKCF